MKQRTARGPRDWDGYPLNHAMVCRWMRKTARMSARMDCRPPRRLSAYLRGNPRAAREPAWVRRMNDPSTWTRDMRGYWNSPGIAAAATAVTILTTTR